MKISYHQFIVSTILTMLLTACSSTPEKQPEAKPVTPGTLAPLGTKYPMEDRLEYMFKCIKQHNSQRSATTPCGCKIDNIAGQLTFKDYETAKTTDIMRRQPGDTGAAFRNPDLAAIRKKLDVADETAEKTCFGK